MKYFEQIDIVSIFFFSFVELLNGVAEIFGTEMVKDFKYKFHHGSKFSVYTYHGCTVNVFGRNQIAPYKSKEHPMIQYLNVHHALENLRKESDTKGKRIRQIIFLIFLNK